MRKFGKTFVLATALIMSMSLLAGCGKDKKEKGVISEQSTTSESENPSKDTTGMTLEEYIEYYGKDVTLGDYKGIEYENAPVQVTDADVQLKVQEFVVPVQPMRRTRRVKPRWGIR